MKNKITLTQTNNTNNKHRIIKLNKKNKGKINLSNKKIQPQKGTGKSRIKNKKSPIFIGGGRAFTKKKNKKLKINKKTLHKCYCLKIKKLINKKTTKKIKINKIKILNKTKQMIKCFKIIKKSYLILINNKKKYKLTPFKNIKNLTIINIKKLIFINLKNCINYLII